MSSISIIFDDSDIEEEEKDDEEKDDESDISYISDISDVDVESDSGNSSDSDESVTFESDEESDEDIEDDGEDVGDVGDESEVTGIDLAEFYDETPKKSTKANFKKKRIKPPKVAKAKRIKKKKGVDDITIPNYLLCEIRDKTLSCIKSLSIMSNVSEKIIKSIERNIYNHAIRNITFILKRPVKSSDLNKDLYKRTYTSISYESITSLIKGINYKDVNSNLDVNKSGINSDSFRNEKFNDSQETNNIENPPKVMRGIHTCSVCIKDKNREDDPDRGKKVDWYQQQTRSCDEPSTTFCKCTDCGKKWRF